MRVVNLDKTQVIANIELHIQLLEQYKSATLVNIAKLKSDCDAYDKLISKAYGDITLVKGSK